MLKKTIRVIAIAALLMAPVFAQERPEKPAPTPKAEPAERPQAAPPRDQGQLVNVRLELTITDQTGPGEPTRKVITMIVADRQNGFIRSKAAVRTSPPPATAGTTIVGFPQYRDVTINVDARPALLKRADEPGNIRVDLGLEYQPTLAGGASSPPGNEPGMSNLNERISVIVEPGKPLTISQAADPSSDRRISVELKATVLK